jgi:hypothetical protein
MDHQKYKYNHIGIPTTKKLENEKHLSDYDIYISGYQENEFNIEWTRYGENCSCPDIVKQLPHIAFEVTDILEAIKGHEVIIEPNNPSEGLLVAFVVINGAPVEFIQWTDRKKFEERYSTMVNARDKASEINS